MHIIAFFLIIIVAIFVMALAAIGSILRSIFGLGRKSNGQQRKYTTTQQNDGTTQSKEDDNKDIHKKQGKIFTEDEGEYVDFEEIKD